MASCGYESDFYASLGLGFGGGTSFTTTYTAYTSPNNGFSTVKEIMFKVGVDDGGKLGKFALKPAVIYAFEIDTEVATGQADGGSNAGKLRRDWCRAGLLQREGRDCRADQGRTVGGRLL